MNTASKWVICLCFVGCRLVLVAAVDECTKATKAETYLDTAAELISKIRDNLPEESDLGCKCPPKPMDCAEHLECGQNTSGIYKVFPRNRILRGSIDVYCDMETEGGGWTVIQRRGDYKRPSDYFNKNWYKYKTGFGDIQRDFWLGNDNIYALSNQRRYYLRIDLTDFENNTKYAFYDQFWIDNESQNYMLHIFDYSGDAGDSITKVHDGRSFSTPDRDNDNSTENCAEKYKSGWWFDNCYAANLNGLYLNSGNDKQKSGGGGSFSEGITWTTWRGKKESLFKTEMKIRPADFRIKVNLDQVEPK